MVCCFALDESDGSRDIDGGVKESVCGSGSGSGRSIGIGGCSTVVAGCGKGSGPGNRSESRLVPRLAHGLFCA